MLRKAERIFVALNGWAVILCLAGMTVVVFANVSLRYLTAQSIPWADEAARYLMIWMTFLGAGLALRQGGHVAITNLQDSLPGPLQRGLRVLIAALLAGFFAFMIWVGRDYMLRMQFQTSPALRLPFIYIYAAMPVGFALMIVHLALIAPGFVAAGRYRPARDAGAAGPDSGPGGAGGTGGTAGPGPG